MLYLALGGAALAAYLWLTGRKGLLKGRGWRIASGAAAVAVFTAAAFAGVRGQWLPAIALVAVGLWLAGSARKAAAPSAPAGLMSLGEARRILGVGEGATRAEIQAAYTRLMRSVHPDKGGTAGLAAQLNAARDRLLSK
ncbi:DnaJ domain-containing protein [uncultured Phenylobacterium sp.]|uniref:DnaJ domain-containing protein n=1 Tax=uncultured Phenylobacterium sp. TaxID=349273 RepID=UPI0025EED625|nr:DnaJ domain-containing protein [uncultured Phenylobacterium sp.]